MNSKAELTNYDSVSDTYIRHIEQETSWNNLYERPAMIALFDNFAEKSVLDLGCGTGFYTDYALKKGASVVAVDASQKMLDYVKSSCDSDKLELRQADLLDGLPFLADSSQDYVICSLVLHYIEEWEGFVNDLYRVVKPGGEVYISIQHPFSDYLHFKKENYFEKSFVNDTWDSKYGPIKVQQFTRSLSETLRPFINSNFKLSKVEEPLPDEKCKRIAPKVYKHLSEKPGFLFLVLEKH